MASAAPLAEASGQDTVAQAVAGDIVMLPVLPASPFTTVAHDSRSGITFSYDAQALIASVDGRKRKLPLTIEHNDVLRHESDTRARGWIQRLWVGGGAEGGEPGVLYADVQLNWLGADEYNSRYFGFTSAGGVGRWVSDMEQRIESLRSLTMTNDPATGMPMAFSVEDGAGDIGQEGDAQDPGPAPEGDTPAVASVGQSQPDDTAAAPDTGQAPNTPKQEQEDAMLPAIRAALGVAEDADEATTLAAIAALTAPAPAADPDATAALTALTAVGFSVAEVPGLVRASELTAARADVVALTAARDQAAAQVIELTAKVDALTAADTARAVALAVDQAIVARKITPAQRDSMLTLARHDLTAFTAAMTGATPIMSDAAGRSAAPISSETLTPEEIAFCQVNGFKEASYLLAKQQRIERTAQ